MILCNKVVCEQCAESWACKKQEAEEKRRKQMSMVQQLPVC